MAYPWYKIIEASDELQQGDLVLNCPTIVPPTFNYTEQDGAEIPNVETTTVKIFNAIIVSQSCDLEHGNIENVLVCPYYPLTDYLTAVLRPNANADEKRRKREDLRKGFLPGYHLINKDEGTNLSDYIVVDFRNVFAVNYDFLKSFVGQMPSRHRLLPPYREHLSQAFARFFMRVGLPIDIQL